MLSGLSFSDRNLILTGYVEPNRPRVARQVAERLGRQFVDVEELIEMRTGDNPEFIREGFGQRRLKTIEDAIMSDIVLYRGAVIRVNGNTLMNNDRFVQLQTTGHIVCLVARLDAVLQRMHLTLGARYHDPQERAIALGELGREWKVRKMPGLI